MDSILNSKTPFMNSQTLEQIKHKIWSPIPRKHLKVEENFSIKAVTVQNQEDSTSSQDNRAPLQSFNPNNSAFRYIFANNSKVNVFELASSVSKSDKGFAFTSDTTNSDKSTSSGIDRSDFFSNKQGALLDSSNFRFNVNSLRELSMISSRHMSVSERKEPFADSFLPKGYLQLFNTLSTKESACGTPSEEKEEQKHKCAHHTNNENGAEKILSFLKPNMTKKKTRHCNCKNSKCLKLYCECLAHGEYCDDSCNCCDCHNNVTKEEVRTYALSLIAEKKPEILQGEGKQKQKSSKIVRGKGCNCKKSACLKKYCECYNAGGGCGPHCKCEGCKNPFAKNEAGDSVKNVEDGSPISADIAQALGLNFKDIARSEKSFGGIDAQRLKNQLLQGGLSILNREFGEISNSSLPILSLPNFENKL